MPGLAPLPSELACSSYLLLVTQPHKLRAVVTVPDNGQKHVPYVASADGHILSTLEGQLPVGFPTALSYIHLQPPRDM